MNFSRFRTLSLSLVSLAATTAYAVDQLPEKEEDIPVEIIPRLDYTLSVGLHQLSKGPKVKFGNLGVVHPQSTLSTTDGVSRVYSNGIVSKDGLYGNEIKTDGSQLKPGESIMTSTYISKVVQAAGGNGVVTVYTPVATAQMNGTEFLLNSDGTYLPVTTPKINVNPDGSTSISDVQVPTWASTNRFLSYKEGQARTWSAQDPRQLDQTNHTVSMSTFGAGSSGESVEADSSGSKGFELSLDRKLGERGRLEWGISAGFKFVDINAKAYKVIDANLVKVTDVYKMVDTGLNFGTTVSNIQPSAVALDLHDLNGQLVHQYVSGTSVLTATANADTSLGTPLYIGTDPTDPNHVVLGDPNHPDIFGTVKIHGFWQLKGAYYLAHFGPTFRYRFNDRWAISGTVGFSIAYVGTVFRADEWFNSFDDVTVDPALYPPLAASGDSATIYTSPEQNTTHKFIPGLYGEVNVEYWMTERTGFYLGVSQQTLRSFSQNRLSGRTAEVDMGTSSGWRIGIITKF